MKYTIYKNDIGQLMAMEGHCEFDGVICHAVDTDGTAPLLHALIKISQTNKNDGNAPLDNKGPTSMEYWRWQESISRRIASDAIENYKEKL